MHAGAPPFAGAIATSETWRSQMNGFSKLTAIRSSLLRAALFTAGVACAFFLNVCTKPVFAIGGCGDVVRQLTATPSTIDRETSTPPFTTTALTWSVDRKGCLSP